MESWFINFFIAVRYPGLLVNEILHTDLQDAQMCQHCCRFCCTESEFYQQHSLLKILKTMTYFVAYHLSLQQYSWRRFTMRHSAISLSCAENIYWQSGCSHQPSRKKHAAPTSSPQNIIGGHLTNFIDKTSTKQQYLYLAYRTCFEVRCDPVWVTDSYNGSFDRTTACYDPTASLIVRITDVCPCTYPSNFYSNKRW